MADTKITGLLTPQVTTNPATDVLPIVNIADTLMAASGSTRKITVNQLLGAGGTATLASATISGAANFNGGALAAYLNGSLMFGSSGNVLNLFAQSSGFHIKNNSGTYPLLTLNNSGDFTVQDGAGSGRLTLNSTGLGIGGAPAGRLSLQTTSGQTNLTLKSAGSTVGAIIGLQSDGTAYFYQGDALPITFSTSGSERMRIDATGNVGIGVASPSNRLEAQEAGTGSGLGGVVSSTATVGGNAGYVFRTGGTNRWSLSLTGSAGAESIRFYDVNNSATRLLIDTSGNVISNVTGTAPTLATNSQMVFNLTSNTNLRISVRGTDGVTRTANITLA